MRKIPQSRRENMKPVKLYLDDVEEIVGYLKEACKKVTIRTEDAELESPDELQALKAEVLRSLDMRGEEPYIHLGMSGGWIILEIGDDTNISVGLFEKVKSVLVRRRRLFYSLLCNHWLSGVSFVVAYAAVLFYPGRNRWVALLACALMVYWLLSAVLTGLQKGYTVVIPKHRTEAPSFIKRNSDTIIAGIIVAVVTYLLTRFFG